MVGSLPISQSSGGSVAFPDYENMSVICEDCTQGNTTYPAGAMVNVPIKFLLMRIDGLLCGRDEKRGDDTWPAGDAAIK